MVEDNLEMTESTTAISDLPRDMVEEVLSRVPLTSLRAVRTSCKNWNTLFKYRSLTRKHISKSRSARKKNEFLAIMMMDYSVYLMSVGIRKDDDYNVESSIERKAKLVSLNDVNGVDIISVFHCSGLLLCLTKEKTPRLVVWNPCRGQTRWIDTKYDRFLRYSFVLGYEKKNSRPRHKILRSSMECTTRDFDIYSFNSDSWKKVVSLTSDNWYFSDYNRGVSLKGNTYWLVQKIDTHWIGPFKQVIRLPSVFPKFYLLCFDFTKERFGPRLPLPFHSRFQDTLTLSSVRDKQLAVLSQRRDTLQMEIWITTKIDPKAVSWIKFLVVDMTPLTYYLFPFEHGSFFVDQEKKIALIFDKDKHVFDDRVRNVAYIIGNDGYLKKVDLGEYTNQTGCSLVCSYFPSSVPIKQSAPQGNHID